MKLSVINYFLIVILLTLAVYVYYPGLSGPFLFDDYYSLSKLRVFEDGISWNSLVSYVNSSDTGMLKRPISMLSFLLNSQTWPSQALSFKATNLFIHCLNGLLLFILLRKIFNASDQYSNQANIIALLSSGLWLLHPFWVSTTLYVVQRMAMLPLTFILFGLIIYLHARISNGTENNKNLLMFLGTFFACALATLSKENGVLLFFYIALFEWLIVRSFLGANPLGFMQQWVYVRLPPMLVIIALVFTLPDIMQGYGLRDFSLGERLMTQSRVLWLYLAEIFGPSHMTAGVFTDIISLSTGLLNPISTLISMIAWLVLLIVTLFIRDKFPWISFAFLFFLVAHLLESTFVPLEMYFEHRNYIAAIFLPVPLVLLCIKAINKSRIFIVLPICFVLYLAMMTHIKASIWGDHNQLHLKTMQAFPQSTRAAIMTADLFAREGNVRLARDILKQAATKNDAIKIKLSYLSLGCDSELFTVQEGDMLLKALSSSPLKRKDLISFKGVFDKVLEGQCLGSDNIVFAGEMLNSQGYKTFINKEVNDIVSDYFSAKLLLHSGDYEKSLSHYTDYVIASSQVTEVIGAIELLLAWNQSEMARVFYNKLKQLISKHQIQIESYQLDTINKLIKFSNRLNGEPL